MVGRKGQSRLHLRNVGPTASQRKDIDGLLGGRETIESLRGHSWKMGALTGNGELGCSVEVVAIVCFGDLRKFEKLSKNDSLKYRKGHR